MSNSAPSAAIVRRFWEKVRITDGCWEWIGYIHPKGYGYGYFGLGRSRYPHRFSYELAYGPIPDGLTIDHLCRNRACVRPDHLEAVTQKENNARSESITAREARQTHCIHGHPFDAANTRVDERGWRECRECERAQARAKYHRDKVREAAIHG